MTHPAGIDADADGDRGVVAGVAEDPNPLLSLVRSCVVWVEDAEGVFQGSGFFVAPSRVLTCGHVAHGAVGLRVVWGDEIASVERVDAVPPLADVAEASAYPLPDVAVLHLEAVSGLAGHPCVRLSPEVPVGGGSPDRLYAPGYAREHDDAIAASTGAAPTFESPFDEDGHTLWKLREAELPRGLSGAPLLNVRTGAVVGIVESSRDPVAPRGGFAVPISEVEKVFADLLASNLAAHETGDGADVWVRAVEDEAARAAWRAGHYDRLPLVAPAEELEWQPGDSIAELLRPVYAVVPYVGRQRLREAMATWCDTAGTETAGLDVWFVTGGGGFGKTRLGMELCVAAERRGWTMGLLDPEVATVDHPGLEKLADWPGRLLVVVDYAEARPAAVKGLVKELRRRPSRPPVRVVALVRRRMTRDELVEHFDVGADATELAEAGEQRLADYPEVRQVLFEELNEAPPDAGFRTLIARAALSRLDETGGDVDRLELCRVARDQFAPMLGGPALDPTRRPPTLRAGHFARPLYVLAAAVLVAAGDDVDIDALSESELLLKVLRDHEAHHWARMFRKGVERGQWDPTLHERDQRMAVALATLLTAADESEATTIAGLVPGISSDRIVGVARWLASLYPDWSSRPGGGRVHPVEPDRLGEVLVTDVLATHPDLLAQAFESASTTQRVRVLTVASRVAADSTIVRAQLRDVLDGSFADLLTEAPARDSALFTALMAAFAVTEPWRAALEAADRLPQPMPVTLGDLRLGRPQVARPHLQVARQLCGLILGIVPLGRRAGGEKAEPGGRERQQRSQEPEHLLHEAPVVPLLAPVAAVEVTAPTVVTGRGPRLRCCHVSSPACPPVPRERGRHRPSATTLRQGSAGGIARDALIAAGCYLVVQANYAGLLAVAHGADVLLRPVARRLPRSGASSTALLHADFVIPCRPRERYGITYLPSGTTAESRVWPAKPWPDRCPCPA